MALTPEDKKDVKKHMGAALANKVSKVTRDSTAKKYLSHVSERAKTSSDYSELQKFKPKGSMSWRSLRAKTPHVEHADDVRSAKTRLAAAKIKHKDAYVESSTHKKGDWMVHYK